MSGTGRLYIPRMRQEIKFHSNLSPAFDLHVKSMSFQVSLLLCSQRMLLSALAVGDALGLCERFRAKIQQQLLIGRERSQLSATKE